MSARVRTLEYLTAAVVPPVAPPCPAGIAPGHARPARARREGITAATVRPRAERPASATTVQYGLLIRGGGRPQVEWYADRATREAWAGFFRAQGVEAREIARARTVRPGYVEYGPTRYV